VKKLSENCRVVLFLPNTRWFGKRAWMYIPYTALILTAILKNKFNFSIIDANANDLSEKAAFEKLKAAKADIVLLSGLSTEYFQHYQCSAKIAKKANPNCITIFGGIFPTIMSDEALNDSNVDYIFIGHAEERLDIFLNLIIEMNKKKIEAFSGIGFRDPNGTPRINAVSSYISKVKTLLKPDYSLIDVETYLNQVNTDYNCTSTTGPSAVLLTSFGCPYNCVFCAARTIGGRGVVFRPAEDVIEEIEYLIREHGIRNLSFWDECFLSNRTRVEKILNTFIERNYNLNWKMPNASAWHLDDTLLELMKRSGCSQITISVESGSPRVLYDIIRKKQLKLNSIPRIVRKCRELGIMMLANFIVGLPGETWDEIRETFRVAENLDVDMVAFHIATPYPKTDLYAIAKEQNLLPPDFHFLDSRFWGTSQGFITTDEFTPTELMVLRAYEWDRINFSSPEKIQKIALMMNISVEELNKIRKQTRLNLGVYSPESRNK